VSLAKFTVASAFGQAFIFFVIREFGSLVNTQVTTLRKLFTIVYGELFGTVKDGIRMEQWFCVVLVFIGVYIGDQDKGKGAHGKEAPVKGAGGEDPGAGAKPAAGGAAAAAVGGGSRPPSRAGSPERGSGGGRPHPEAN
jgi:UDP-galactose transporter B1